MLVHLSGRPAWQRLVVLGVQIVFVELSAVNKNLAVSHFDRFTGQPDDAFNVAFVGIVRKPENDDIAALYMPPTDALDLVINEFVDQKTLAVMKFRQHRRAFDNDRLD